MSMPYHDAYDDSSPYNDAIPFVEYVAGEQLSPYSQAPQASASVEVPGNAPSPLVSPQVPASQRQTPTVNSRSPFIAALLVVLAFAVVIGSGITYYANVPYPATLNAQATAVAQGILQSQQQVVAATATASYSSPASLYASFIKTPPDIVDALNGPTTSVWSADDTSPNFCFFSGQTYHAKAIANSPGTACYTGIPGLYNFAFQVQTTVLSGLGSGIDFRAHYQPGFSGYTFFLDRSGQYVLAVTSASGSYYTLANGFTSFARTGLNQSNLLTVIALKSTLYVYVNGQVVAKVNDTTFDHGLIGLVSENEQGSTSTSVAEAAFSNAQIWTR